MVPGVAFASGGARGVVAGRLPGAAATEGARAEAGAAAARLRGPLASDARNVCSHVSSGAPSSLLDSSSTSSAAAASIAGGHTAARQNCM